MRIQFSTTEATSSPQLINSLWFETQPPPGGTKIDPPDNTGGGGTGSGTPEPEEEEEEGGAGS